MNELLNQFGEPANQFPAIIIPEPFTLANQDQFHLDKIRDEVMDKVRTWENSLSPFFGEWNELSMNWRVQSRDQGKKKNGFHNSKSGETHRAVETLATVWFRMLTASDSYFEAVANGFDPLGNELSPNDLYAIEKVLMTQLRTFKFKEKLLRSLTSLALFGTEIFEEPWRQKKSGDGTTYAEGTDLEHRSLIQTGFDTTVYEIDQSDFIFTVDFPTVWRLRAWAQQSPEIWDKSRVERHISDTEYSKTGTDLKKGTNVYHRITERQQRAGYTVNDNNVRELISYHGKLDINNPVIAAYWESTGNQEDPANVDFTTGIMQGEEVARFHMTQYGTWHSRFKSVHFKPFELEPLSYGAGRIGKKTQRLLDANESRIDDASAFNTYGMWKLGRFSGIKPSQFAIKPWGIIDLESIDQLEQLKFDASLIAQALAIQLQRRENFRADTGASSNLQAIETKATATEASLTQTEAIRGASVHAEIIAEVLIREHLEQMHINNLDNLDSEIWVAISGENKPRYYNRFNLPRNVGFEIRVTTDKNFRPERTQKLLEALQMCTSIRNLVPGSINAVAPLFEEFFRTLDLNPRLLTRPIPIADQLIDSVRRAQRMGGNPQLMNETDAEKGGNPNGNGSNISTPMGDIPTSPIGSIGNTSAA